MKEICKCGSGYVDFSIDNELCPECFESSQQALLENLSDEQKDLLYNINFTRY